MSRSVASVISATARAKACSLCAAGEVKPETFLTYWRAASSIAARSSTSRPSRSLWMDLHMAVTVDAAQTTGMRSSIACPTMTIEEHEAHATERAHATEADFRLPRTVIPERYRIVIEPDLDTADFAGSVDIDVDVTSPTAVVVLNAVDLEILDAEVSSDGATLSADTSLDPETGRTTTIERIQAFCP